MIDKDLAYIAGFLDGEGTICITHAAHNRLQASIAIYNNHKQTLDWINEKLCLCKTVDIRKGSCNSRNHNHICYHIYSRKKEKIREVLEMLYPYLHTKKKQAELVLSFLNNNAVHNENYFMCCTKLNHGGN